MWLRVCRKFEGRTNGRLSAFSIADHVARRNSCQDLAAYRRLGKRLTVVVRVIVYPHLESTTEVICEFQIR